MKKFLLILFSAFLVSACSSDDSGNVVSPIVSETPVETLVAGFESGSSMSVGTKVKARSRALAYSSTEEANVAWPQNSTDASNQPYGWADQWDGDSYKGGTTLQTDKKLKWVAPGDNTINKNGNEDYTGWADVNVQGDGDSFNSKVTIENLTENVVFTATGQEEVLCPLASKNSRAVAFGVYIIDTKEKLPSMSISWNNGNGQKLNDDRTVRAYKFKLEPGTQYGIYVEINSETTLYSGDSNKDNLIAVAGNIDVVRDNNVTHRFVSFEDNLQNGNVSDLIFAFLSDDNVELPIPDIEEDLIVRADDFCLKYQVAKDEFVYKAVTDKQYSGKYMNVGADESITINVNNILADGLNTVPTGVNEWTYEVYLWLTNTKGEGVTVAEPGYIIGTPTGKIVNVLGGKHIDKYGNEYTEKAYSYEEYAPVEFPYGGPYKVTYMAFRGNQGHGVGYIKVSVHVFKQ